MPVESAPNLETELLHHRERLEMLGELNKVIASGVGLEKVSRTLARQAGFRFSADCALVLVLSEAGEKFEVAGTYGLTGYDIPTEINIEQTLMGRALRLGGILTVPDITLQSDHGLNFLSDAGITCIHTCSMEARKETMGAILVGYRTKHVLSEEYSSMFAEFVQGCAAAVGSALFLARLQSYNEKLEELVHRRTADLEAQKEIAEEANRAKGRFVANMSHELRTPLTAVIGYSSVLADGVFGTVNEKQHDALQSIARSSEHLKELIDEVLNLSRIEAGKEDPEPSKVELGSLLQQTYKLMLQGAVGKQITLAPLNITETMKHLKLWVDPRHVRQILLNLMSNAIKYTQSGGTVRLTTELVGDKIKISVSDNGVGISQDLVNRLFLRFERGADQYSREQMGTGIGLSLTKKLVEMNGGVIGVESSPNVGSTFWILVPAAEQSGIDQEGIEDSLDISARDSRRELRLDGLNVLILDDNALTGDVLKILIERCGGNPFVTSSVKEAKTLLETVQLDAALVDLAMPGESGISFIDYLRKECDQELAKIPIIVVSACVFNEDREIAMQKGASLFLPKPFRPQDITQAVRSLTTAGYVNTRSQIGLTAVKL